MPEPVDLLNKLEDSKEIALDLVNELSGNPVSSLEEELLSHVMDVCNLLRSAVRKTEHLVTDWP